MKGSKPEHGAGREALLAAVVDVVADHGLRGVTFRAVAERANVNNTLILHHFGNRAALLSAALDWSVERSLEQSKLSEYSQDTKTFRRNLVEKLLASPELEAFQLEMSLEARRQPSLRPAVHRLYERYLTDFSESRNQSGLETSHPLNRALFASIDGLVFQYLTHAISKEEFIESLDELGEFISRP